MIVSKNAAHKRLTHTIGLIEQIPELRVTKAPSELLFPHNKVSQDALQEVEPEVSEQKLVVEEIGIVKMRRGLMLTPDDQ